MSGAISSAPTQKFPFAHWARIGRNNSSFYADIARGLSRRAGDRLSNRTRCSRTGGVAVAVRPIPAAVVDPKDRLDAEIAVVDSPVPGQPRRTALDVEAVVPRPLCELPFSRLWRSFFGQRTRPAAVADQVSADDVCAPESGRSDSEADADVSARDELCATRFSCPLSTAMPSRPPETWFRVITLSLPGPRVMPRRFRRSGCA